MAKHIRQQLREAVIAALKGNTAAGQNVFGRRDWPLDATYPAIIVWTEGGPSAFESMADTDAVRPLERIERVVVEVRVRHGGGEDAAPRLEDDLDARAAEVEPLMMSDEDIGNLVTERQLIESEPTSLIAGDARIGALRLTYRLITVTAAGNPTEDEITFALGNPAEGWGVGDPGADVLIGYPV